MKWKWFVVRIIEDRPPEVFPFEELSQAEAFYEKAAWNWSDVYLCEILKPLR